MPGAQISTMENGSSTCRFCKGNLVFDPNSGERVCCSCGVVYGSSSTSLQHFSRSFGSNLGTELYDHDPRTGMMYDIELPATIDARNVDASGRGVYDSIELRRMRKLNSLIITRDSKRKSLSKAVDTIRRTVETLSLGETVAERAFQIYRKSNGDGLARRKAIIPLAIASVYVACKELGVARSTHEIESVVDEVNLRSVRRQYSLLLKKLGLSVTVSDPLSFIPRIASRAGISGRVERKAIQILQKVKDDPILISKKPVPLAAAALYLSAQLLGEPITQLRVACAGDITPVTIRKRSSEISKILEPKTLEPQPQHERAQEMVLEQPLIAQ